MNWTKEEFEIYTLLFAANVDLKMDEKELSFISAEVEPETFQKVLAVFQKDNDAQRIKNITTYQSHFLKTNSEKEEFFKEIKKLFFADGNYSAIEAGIFATLKRIF